LRIVDANSGAPIPTAMAVTNGRPAVRADSLGTLLLSTATHGTSLEIRAVGYRVWKGELLDRQPVRTIRLEMVSTVLQTVSVRSRALGTGSVMQATSVIGAEQLAERMAPSVAATIANEPGVSVRTNGPMASQPVIRGLGGDRVLVLEDGLRTGDIATTAPDHAVTIEPATAKRIEVIRGPAGLLYGSNTLGGVVNVVRDDVPRERVRGVQWSASSFGESVNRGVGTAGRVQAGAGAFTVQLDGSGRTAGDTRTPRGIALPFTDVDGFDAGIGAGLVHERGHLGVAARDYRTFYGVPSSYNGATLPGAHDGGVYVDVRRSSARMDAEWRPEDRTIEAVSFGANGVRFEQSEAEQGGFVGTRFGQLATSGEAVVRLRNDRHRGAVGAFGAWRDLRAEGSFTGTRPAVQRTLAMFAVDEVSLGRVTMLTGLRLDRIITRPLDSTETLLLRNVRSRSFSAVTGAIGANVLVGRGFSLSAQVARAFRPPSIEELFSAGPHLASYSYEVGMPELAAERGLGADAVIRWQGAHGRAEFAAYRMQVSDYITFAPQIESSTGLPLRDPRLRRYVVYRPQQTDAVLSGVEGRVVLTPSSRWLLDVTGAMPRGSTSSGAPLPAMPAASVRADVRRVFNAVTAGISFDRRFAQRRVPAAPVESGVSCRVLVVDGEATALPAEFCETPAALLVGATIRAPLPRSLRGRWPTALTVSADNLLDAEWRDPLWRAKQVAPQPGRNIRIALQVTP
jgi:iron complex outermembrane receptor protein